MLVSENVMVMLEEHGYLYCFIQVIEFPWRIHMKKRLNDKTTGAIPEYSSNRFLIYVTREKREGRLQISKGFRVGAACN